MRSRLLALAAALAAAACVEELTAPGPCPDLCIDRLSVTDTILRTVVERDTSFRGYIFPHQGRVLPVVDVGGGASRSYALYRSVGIPHTYQFGSDPTQNPIVGVDSLRLSITIVLRDTSARNLRLHLHRIPKEVDSSTTFLEVAPSFADSLVRSVNVDSLLAVPTTRDTVLMADVHRDTLTGDYLRVDAATGVVNLSMKLDSAQAPYVQTDGGVLAFGVSGTTDTETSIALGASEGGAGMLITWYVQVDSLGLDTVPRRPPPAALGAFDTFVLDPPLPLMDSTLAVGGAPVARSVLRVGLPSAIRDSAQVIRATLMLVPDRAAQGAPADSFLVVAHRALIDLGAKSPLADPAPDSSHAALGWVRIGSLDTVRIEVTRILRLWGADTTAPMTLVLQQSISPVDIVEGATISEIRFKPSSDAAFRPAIHVTYVPRIRFDIP